MPLTDTIEEEKETVIIDSSLSFEEAISGTKAPQSIINELILFDVLYLSTDGKLHQGQILTNKKIEPDIRQIFDFMLENNFAVEKAIPIVHYNWSDSLSMDDNNTYSFCYRNISYSKHARGMAIDINPRFNPLRWKKINRPNQPKDAVLDTTVNGALHPEHVVVKEFKRLGFRWGHTFSKYYDDHHFEKR
ncbi:MAG: M15 family metallopeptidase [Bacteroidia bacterium]|nr:M15 family metallopeptidase [Bacteroidia bacterium]